MISPMGRFAPLAFALALGACGLDASPPVHVSEHFVMVRLYIDPSTRLGEFVRGSPQGIALEEGLARLDCTQDYVVVIHVAGDVVDGSAVGRAQLLLASHPSELNICDGGGAVVIEPASYLDLENDVAHVEGPVLIEGETLDGRLPLGGLGVSTFEVFPEWWQISARATGLDRVVQGIEGGSVRLTGARAEAVWSVHQMVAELLTDIDPAADPRLSVLDLILGEGIQPDVDVDGDGFERFLDTDGNLVADVCIDGDGERVVGEGCAAGPRFADGYELRLVFRAEPVTPAD